jgi:hypothetical protein
MNTHREPSDEALRKLLREWEDERGKRAPSFERVWHRARRMTQHGREPRRPAACAACAALLLVLALRAPHELAPARPALAEAIVSTQDAVARMPDQSLASLSTLPAWMSPTDALLDAPRFTP